VVRVLDKLAIPFNTKKRAPFRIVFETVALSEIKGRDHDEKQEELQSKPQKDLEKSNTETNQ
jgi:hypothetical protein